MNTYHKAIELLMKVFAGIFTFFALFGLAKQVVFGSRFFDRDLTFAEILILLAGVAFAWMIALAYRPWMNFMSSLVGKNR